jgi:uncharacterized protein YjbI with pentapeptide repeats
MANHEHVAILKKGVTTWNAWRDENPDILPDLSGADLRGLNLPRANLRKANLSEAKLHRTNCWLANLTGAILIEANLWLADLTGAILIRANLTRAHLSGVDLTTANLTEAILSGANLQTVTLVKTDLTGADLTGCRVYGISAWDLKLDSRTKQQNLVITLENESTITVDTIEVAQFVYLLLRNEKIRDVIDTISSKAVLILGRFTDERKAVLDALREELRKRDYLPILFDFSVPATRDITETVSLLARMARFIIADLTDPSSIPKELEAIVPQLAVPVQPLLEGASRPMRCSKTIGSTTGCFRSTDTRDWSRCSQRSRRTSSPLRKERRKPWKSDGASSRRN